MKVRFLALGGCVLAALVAQGGVAEAQPQIPLQTWFSASRGDHFTTSNPAWAGRTGEVRAEGGGSGYVMLRVEGQVFDPGQPQPPETVPLYSFWNPERGDNFITSDPRWVGQTQSQGYGRFRLEGYVHAAPGAGRMPLRSFWSDGRKDNYASSDPRLAVPIGGLAVERTMSVEGGQYGHYRVEGYLAAPAGPAPTPRPAALNGLVDMHAHLMSHLAFGKKLIHGAPDIGSLLPAGTRDCNAGDIRATSIGQALGHDNSTHGGHDLGSNTCGNHQRRVVIDVFEGAQGAASGHGADKGGWPAFVHWPKHNDLTHQQMWVDWIKRAHAGGLRVMVALATNNSTFGTALRGDGPLDDRTSADLQIREIQSFVRRHDDNERDGFMRLVFTPQELRAAVAAGKLAVVVGIEVDDLGNFTGRPAETVTRAAISAEVDRLRALGVRYVFPVHVTNNRFAGTAVYQEFFNVANRVQDGAWLDLECSPSVGWQHGATQGSLVDIFSLDRPAYAACASGSGHRNRLGLTGAGREVIDVLMRRGMIIDVDHMSERAVDDALTLARDFPSGWGYPVVSGHNGPRNDEDPKRSERHLRGDQLKAIRDLGGMLGLGWANQDAAGLRENFRKARDLMGDGRVGFGTDMNGLEKHVKPRAGTTVRTTWTTGSRTWDYRIDGVANYGMIPELIQDLRNLDAADSRPAGVSHLFGAAEAFARVWERAELSQRSALPVAPVPPDVTTFTPAPTGFLCPTQVVAGDREFDGHGPEIWIETQLERRSDGAVEAVTTMRARETQHDWSEGRGTWRTQVSPPGMRVAEILSETRSSTHVVSSPAGFQVVGPGPIQSAVARPPVTGGLVNFYEVVGDTGGPDISTDDDCNDDTRVRIVFRPIQVRVAR